jgi:hypothetical protein
VLAHVGVHGGQGVVQEVHVGVADQRESEGRDKWAYK